MHLILLKIILLSQIMLSWSNFALANQYESITYNLDLAKIEHSILKIETIIEGDFNGQVLLDLPTSWAGVDYTTQVKNVRINDSTLIKPNLNSDSGQLQAMIKIQKEPTRQLTASYEIHQKVDDPSNVHEAIIRTDLVHAPGYALFALPHDLEDIKLVKIKINWHNLPPKWHTISSHGTDQTIVLNKRMTGLLHAIYVAGKIRLSIINMDEQILALSLYGQFDISDSKIISDLKEIIHNQRSFFQDSDFPYYAITLIEGQNPYSMGGTMLTNSFAAFLPKGMERMDYYLLFAHEHLHNWIGGKIKRDASDKLHYWWSEGFTDFYCRLIALRSKALNQDMFIDEVNKFLRAYYFSPVNQEPNERIDKDFWHDQDVEKSPYYRGFVFALYLNNLIKNQDAKHSLDDVMKDLFVLSKKHQFSSELFATLLSNYVKNGIKQELEQFIAQGKLIDLADLKLPIEKRSMGRYQLGFESDALRKNKVIKNIDPKSNAYQAGLRNGQKIIKINAPKGKGDADQIVTIETNAGNFEFKPEHYEKIDIYQINTKLSPDQQKEFNKFWGLEGE